MYNKAFPLPTLTSFVFKNVCRSWFYNHVPKNLILTSCRIQFSDGALSQRHALHYDVTEAGSEQGLGVQVFGPDVQPRHCVFASSGGLVTATPCSREAETYVNDQRVWETTILQHGCTVRLGRHHVFRFVDPTTASVRRDSPDKTFETTFDVTGHVETTEAASQRCDPILPAVLEFREETRDNLLEALVGSLDTSAIHFKLAPTYALYLATRLVSNAFIN